MKQITRSRRTVVRHLADLTADPQNANRGTPRGRAALAHSLRDYGAGRARIQSLDDLQPDPFNANRGTDRGRADLRDDHVNVPTAPGAGHEEPVFPWSCADFRNHVLRLVRTNVPEIMADLHTIADLSDPDQIRRDIDACATRWQLDTPWTRRTMHRTVRFWHLAPAMRASRQWPPVLPENGWGRQSSWRRRKVPQYRGFNRSPRARSKRPSCSTGGSDTTCCTKDTRPSRATPTVRPPSVSPSAGLHMRSSVPSGRAALGGLEHAHSDAECLRTFRDALVLVFVPLRSVCLVPGRHATGALGPSRGVAQRRNAGTSAGRHERRIR